MTVACCASGGSSRWTDRHTHAARPQPARHLWQPAAGDAAGELPPYGATHPGHAHHSCSGPEGVSVPMFVIRKRRQITAMRNMLQPATAPLQATDGPFLSRCVVSFSFMVCSGHHVSLRLLSLLRVMNISPSHKKKKKNQKIHLTEA